MSDFKLRIVDAFSQFSKSEWDALNGTSNLQNEGNFNPFSSHEFLSSLEDSNCVNAHTGWLPQHLRLENAQGQLIGAMPCYVKSHSQGEYVFDHGWADAFERAGGRYYPKAQACIPFTPVTGPRLLCNNAFPKDVVFSALGQGLIALCQHHNLSSAHVTFGQEEEMKCLENLEFLMRIDQQFHFQNKGYKTYDDFLQTLTSRKRKSLRKERERALQNGIEIEWLSGKDLTQSVWDDFYIFYTDTADKKWGRPYLNREFFSLLGERMSNQIVLMIAKRAGKRIAGAINFLGSNTIYGRHWGCIEDHPFLHFELCYHQAIDYALAHNLQTVEAGAQGQHKLARGYEPIITRSAHFIAHLGLRDAIAHYLIEERDQVNEISTLLCDHTPFKKG